MTVTGRSSGVAVLEATILPAEFAELVTLCIHSGVPVSVATYAGGRACVWVGDSHLARRIAQSWTGRVELTVRAGAHGGHALSQREQDLLAHFAAGLQLKEAARRMGVATTTAREYWLRAKRKLGARSTAQAAAIWTFENATSDITRVPDPVLEQRAAC